MDFSSMPQDGEHPAEASPWSSSPQASRHSFPSSDDTPSSPFASQDSVGNTQRLSHDSDDSSRRQHDSGGAHNSGGDSPTPQTAPVRQPGQPRTQGERHRPIKPPAKPKQPPQQYKLKAKITGLERTDRKDPILKFDVHTDLPKFRTTQFRDVRRTHSEFVKLSDHLISSCPESFVPAVPPSLTSAGAGTDEDESRVIKSLQRWLNYVCSNHVLMRDEEMVYFVESDFGYSPVIRRKQPATGVRRKVIKQFAPPPDENVELRDARPVVKLFYLGTMDASHKVDRIVKSRKVLGLAESDFGVKLSAMNVQEPHPGLALAYRKLGKIIQTTGDFHAAQGTVEATVLGDSLQYHSSDAFIVKETLTNRHILLRELLQAEQTLRSKLNAADRIKASTSIKSDKATDAIAAVEEAKANQAHLSQKAAQVTGNLTLESRTWFTRTAADLRASLREYVVREIEAERRTLALLEQVRPDIRAIDASGGLSRLGREAHPATRRASLGPSQGPKGDAWSGLPRRPDGLSRSISSSQGLGAVGEGENEDGGREGGDIVKGSKAVRDEREDENRVDARNAANRLAQSTFS
ncbi:MAG: Vacuolar protein sorting-associated protein 17 [Vezdaea aestivalis]|nr:MAG: Vacuolar protein sorting-associated protein 17 [Vezdaea aestivalis]